MKTFIYAAMLAVTLSGCATGPNTKTSNTKSKPPTQAEAAEEAKSILALLGRTPPTLGDADAIGALLQTAYVGEIGNIEKTRRNFNLAGIMAQTYSAIGAGLQVHPHNLIISTALTGAIPTVATQFAPPKVEDAIVTASANTNCIRRAIGITLGSDFEANITILEQSSADDMSTGNLAKYNRLKGSAMAGYSRAYLSYVVARVPPLLDTEALKKHVPAKAPETTDQSTGGNGADTVTAGGGQPIPPPPPSPDPGIVMHGVTPGSGSGSVPPFIKLKPAKSDAEKEALTAANASVKTAVEFAEKNIDQCFSSSATAPTTLAAAAPAGTVKPPK